MGKRKRKRRKANQKQDNPANKIAATSAASEGQLYEHNSINYGGGPEDRDTQQKPAEEYMGFVIRWWGFVRSESNGIIAILTAVIALTGGIYAAFSYLQWTAVNDQLTELKNASRPYIFAQIGLSWPTGVSPKPEDVTEVPVTISLVNAGTSPALHVTGSDTLVGLDSDAYIKEHLSSCSFTYHNDERGFPLAPSQVPGSPGLTFTTQKRTLSDDEKRDVFVNKTKHIVALGSIKYSGVRPGEYRTDYCYVWDPDSLTSRHFAWSDCSCTSIQ